MVLMVTVDQQKEGIKLDVHSNETLLSVRHKIARRLGVAIDELSVGVADRWLESMDNNKLVCQVEFSGPPTLIAKTHVATGYGRGVEVGRVGLKVVCLWLEFYCFGGVQIVVCRTWLHVYVRTCGLYEYLCPRKNEMF